MCLMSMCTLWRNCDIDKGSTDTTVVLDYYILGMRGTYLVSMRTLWFMSLRTRFDLRLAVTVISISVAEPESLNTENPCIPW